MYFSYSNNWHTSVHRKKYSNKKHINKERKGVLIIMIEPVKYKLAGGKYCG